MPIHSKKRNGAVMLGSLVSLAATLGLLGGLLLGAPAEPQRQQGAQLELSKQFSRTVTNSLSDGLGDISVADMGISIRKEYWLSDEDQVAPEPDPACYGRTTDPRDLEPVIAQAQELLDGQELVFSTDVTITEGSEVAWYLDETILMISWKETFSWREYTFTEVKILHPSQFRRFLSGGEYGSGVLYTASEMSASVNAVVASSADYYGYRPFGNMVYNGEVVRWGDNLLDTCYVDVNGDLHFARTAELIEKEEIEAYVQEHDIRFSLAFGPLMLLDGERVWHGYYPIGEVNKFYSRAALCQQGKLHYLVVAANRSGSDIYLFSKTLMSKGIRTAYALDGGQTATIVIQDQAFNHVDYGGERKISDIIYFATAIPDGG